MSGRAHARLWIAVGLIAALLYSNFIIDWFMSDFTGMDRVVSYLESPGEPNATLLRVTDVVCALLVFSMLPSVRRALPAGGATNLVVISTTIFGLGAIVAAFVPMPCGLGEPCTSSSQQLSANIHDLASVISETAVFVGVAAAWWATRTEGPRWVNQITPWLFWIAGAVTTAVFTYYGEFTDRHDLTAYSQRIHILGVSVWLACLGFIAARDTKVQESANP